MKKKRQRDPEKPKNNPRPGEHWLVNGGAVVRVIEYDGARLGSRHRGYACAPVKRKRFHLISDEHFRKLVRAV